MCCKHSYTSSNRTKSPTAESRTEQHTDSERITAVSGTCRWSGLKLMRVYSTSCQSQGEGLHRGYHTLVYTNHQNRGCYNVPDQWPTELSLLHGTHQWPPEPRLLHCTRPVTTRTEPATLYPASDHQNRACYTVPNQWPTELRLLHWTWQVINRTKNATPYPTSDPTRTLATVTHLYTKDAHQSCVQTATWSYSGSM